MSPAERDGSPETGDTKEEKTPGPPDTGVTSGVAVGPRRDTADGTPDTRYTTTDRQPSLALHPSPTPNPEDNRGLHRYRGEDDPRRTTQSDLYVPKNGDPLLRPDSSPPLLGLVHVGTSRSSCRSTVVHRRDTTVTPSYLSYTRPRDHFRRHDSLRQEGGIHRVGLGCSPDNASVPTEGAPGLDTTPPGPTGDTTHDNTTSGFTTNPHSPRVPC